MVHGTRNMIAWRLKLTSELEHEHEHGTPDPSTQPILVPGNPLREAEIYLVGEGARGGQGVADEVAGGDVRDAEQLREAAGVGALAHPGAPEEHPLHAPPVLLIPPPATGRRLSQTRPRRRRLFLRQHRPRSSGQGPPGRGGAGPDCARDGRHLAGSARGTKTSRAAEIILGFFFLFVARW